MGWLIALGVIALLLTVPLGIGGTYSEAGYQLYARIGPVKLRLLPRQKKKKTDKPKTQKQSAPKEKKGGSLSEFYPVIRLVWDFLKKLRKKLRVNHLQLKITLAGGDPADLALNYGRAWTAVGNLMPLLERFLVIKKRDVQVLCDFAGDKTLILAGGDVTITVGRILHLSLWHGLPVLREFMKIINKSKGGATI